MSREFPPLLSRRRLLTCVAFGAASLPLARQVQAQGTELPHLDPSDPAAKSLAYSENASKVDAKVESTFKAAIAVATANSFRRPRPRATTPCV